MERGGVDFAAEIEIAKTPGKIDESWLKRMMMILIRVSIHDEAEIMFLCGSQGRVSGRRACQYLWRQHGRLADGSKPRG